MRLDIESILKVVRPVTFRLVLATNGTLIDEPKASLIADFFDLVNLTIHSGEAASYESFSGCKDTFNQCLRSLSLLSKKGVKVVVQTVVSRSNVQWLEKLGEIIAKAGASAWVVRLPFRSGRLKKNESEFLAHGDLPALIPLFDRLRVNAAEQFAELRIGLPFSWTYERGYEKTERPDRLVTCAAGTVMAALTATGRLAPCSLFSNTEFASEPVWETGLLEQWKSAKCFSFLRALRLTSIQQCAACKDFGALCNGGCRAKAYLAGDITSPDPSCGYNPQRG